MAQQMSATGMPSAPCFRMNAFWASENRDAFIALRSAGCPRTRCRHRQARQAANDRQRQWDRADQHGDPVLVASCKHRLALHRARQTATKCVRGEFNGRPRDELLNETLFTSLDHAREALAGWKDDFNTIRPHSALGNVPPAVYAKLSVPSMQRDGALEPLRGLAPHPVAPPSLLGSNDGRILPIAG